MNVNDALNEFRGALSARGLLVEQVEADGRLHRCAVTGAKSGRKDGSYILHLDGVPAGGYDNWRDGLGWQTWCAKREREMSREERTALSRHMQLLKIERMRDQNQRYIEAAGRAAKLWHLSKPATDANLYLVKKGVHAYGLRQLREQLVIPLRDSTGALSSLQFISPVGEKRFLTGGRKRGCYFAIGTPQGVLCICEGYATAASVFESTGHATAVAFDAGNLQPVACDLRKKFPFTSIVICADNDCETAGNPGISRAVAAARAVRGRVAVPHFGVPA